MSLRFNLPLARLYRPVTLSIQSLLIVAFVVQIVGAVGLISYLSYRSRRHAMQDLANQLIDKTAMQVSDRLDEFLATPQHLLELNRRSAEARDLDLGDFAQLERRFLRQTQTFDSVTTIGFGNLRGEVIGVGHDRLGQGAAPNQLTSWMVQGSVPGNRTVYRLDAAGKRQELLSTLPNYDARESVWYQTAIASNQQTWSSVYPVVNRPTAMISASTPVYLDGKLQGVFHADVLLSDISLFLSTLKVSPSVQIFIMERSGNLIATSTQEPTYTNVKDQPLERLPANHSGDWLTRLTAQTLQNQMGNLARVNHADLIFFADQSGSAQTTPFWGRGDRQRYFADVTPYRDAYGLDWLIVTVVPESDFMAATNADLHRTLCLCGLVLLGSVGIAIVIAGKIARPLEQINQATKKFVVDQFDDAIPSSSIREIKELELSFRQMVAQISVSFQALKESEQKFTTLFDSVPVGISMFDATGKLVMLNRHGAEIAGQSTLYVPIESVSSVYQVYIAGTNQLYPTEQLPPSRALRGETVSIDNLEIVMGDRRIPLDVKTIPVFDDQGHVLYAINTFQDITLQRQSEQLHASYAKDLEQQVLEKTADLQTSQTNLNAILDNALAYISKIYLFPDYSTQMVYISKGCLELYGYSVEAMAADPNLWRSRVHPDDWQTILLPTYQAILAGQTNPPTEEFRYYHPNGSLRWINSRLSARWDDAKQVWIVTTVSIDISDRKQAEALIQKALDEKEVLLREIHHRVKNNLQLIQSMLRMQQRRSRNPEVVRSLKDSCDRIVSISLVHELLYQSSDLAQINLKNYIPLLLSCLSASYDSDDQSIEWISQIEPVVVPIETAICCGLILNELISNALKHAFSDTCDRKIEIKVWVDLDDTLRHLHLTIQDFGIGLPEQFDLAQVNSLGLNLVQDFVCQLNGKLTIESHQGTLFHITLPTL